MVIGLHYIAQSVAVALSTGQQLLVIGIMPLPEGTI